MNRFAYVSYAQEVIFAPGAITRLSEAVDRFGWQRLLLCANHSLQTSGTVDVVKSGLGDRLVAVFDRVQPHVQDTQVNEVAAIAVQENVDAIIGLGGGSPIGIAKAVASSLEEQRTGHPARAAYPTEQPLVPVVAIPTTYAGSEMTSGYGVTHTDENPPRKVTVNDPKITPKLVIYDPELTYNLPPIMTASTGINALAHCVEALYSVHRNPISTATATHGVRTIHSALLTCYRDGKNVEARSKMLLGAHLAGLSLASVSMGLHHGVCHVLGGSVDIPHGIANSIILPHAIRFNADFTAAQLLPAAEAMGIEVSDNSPAGVVETMALSISNLISKMNVPQRLRDVGVKKTDLPRLAQMAFQNRSVQNNPKPIQDASQIEGLLREAW